MRQNVAKRALRFEPLENRVLLSVNVTPTFKTFEFTTTGNAYSGQADVYPGYHVDFSGTAPVQGTAVYTSATAGTWTGTATGSGSYTDNEPSSGSYTFTGHGEVTDNGGSLSGYGYGDTFNSESLVGSGYEGPWGPEGTSGAFDTSDFSIDVAWDITKLSFGLTTTGTWSGTMVPNSAAPLNAYPTAGELTAAGVDFDFVVAGPPAHAASHTTAVSDVRLFWASGTSTANIIGSALETVSVYWNQSGGAVSATGLGTPPAEATHLLVVTDYANTLTEGNESDNVLALNLGDTAALYAPTSSTYFLRDCHYGGNADAIFGYGPGGAGWTPLMGDYNASGTDTAGLYNPTSGVFYLHNSNAAGNADIAFGYGPGGQGWQPLIGDWNGNGLDSIGLYNPATGVFYLKNTNAAGNADVAFGYGPGGQGWRPLIGDWNGDGTDSIGVYNPTTGVFYLRNTNTAGNADAAFQYGPGSWQPLAGDWNGDGADTIGLYNATNSVFYLRNTNAAGVADRAFAYGPPGGGWQPLIGNWDGGATLLAAAGLVDNPDAAALSQADLQPIVSQAIADWADLGLATDQLADLVAVRFVITDLSGAQLGLAERDTIFLDLNAAGHGWFVDPTPASDEEFIAGAAGRLTAIDPAAVDRIDLLTVVSHELGHALGLSDLDASVEALMSGTLESGVRRGPT